MQFLKIQGLICFGLGIVLFVAVWFLTKKGLTTALCFLIGTFISLVAGIASLFIAVQANYRTAYCARFGLAATFQIAYRASTSVGFGVASLSLLAVILILNIVKQINGIQDSSDDSEYYQDLFQAVAGYGLGSTLAALFGRMGGGIYAKAAELGANLVGKVEAGMVRHNPRNPATIAHCVGDNVSDILGAGIDLSSSLTTALCAALILTCTSLTGYQQTEIRCGYAIANLMYPLVMLSFCFFLGIFISAIATHFQWTETQSQIKKTLNIQLFIGPLLFAGVCYLAAFLTFPSKFQIARLLDRYYDIQQTWIPFLCSSMGILVWMGVSLFTDLLTSSKFPPVRWLAESCRSSQAANVTLGLAMGYMSTIVPIIMVVAAGYFANMFLGFYGISLAALGMLAAFPVSLALSSLQSLSRNTSQIVHMAGLGDDAKDNSISLLRQAGSSASMIRACSVTITTLSTLALYGGFLFNAKLSTVSSEDSIAITKAEVFAGLLVGAALPFIFSGLTLKGSRRAALVLMEEVLFQFTQDPQIIQGQNEPNYTSVVGNGVYCTLKHLIIPVVLVIFIPLGLGFATGPGILAGLMVGLAVSSLQLAVSGANSGTALQNTRNYIQRGELVDEEGNQIGAGSGAHKASITGDQFGQPLQGTASPALNTVAKMVGMLCLVFGEEIAQLHS